jgi:hypothetical protein
MIRMNKRIIDRLLETKTPSQLARDFNVSPQCLHYWKNKTDVPAKYYPVASRLLGIDVIDLYASH